MPGEVGGKRFGGNAAGVERPGRRVASLEGPRETLAVRTGDDVDRQIGRGPSGVPLRNVDAGGVDLGTGERRGGERGSHDAGGEFRLAQRGGAIDVEAIERPGNWTAARALPNRPPGERELAAQCERR
jgi:hypothetical protein